ncbi:unnamed protein product [Strongylus vulgaris]|uniref:Uncharacterized protein n=1 Tax=Strongylus vulgaris TaxID=40348 RepID=A0A3P7J1F1_STRVU|nr:unnamed protein product [Strongylus vulgaris]
MVGSKKGGKALRDAFHEEWAQQLTKLGFAERTASQVAEKLKKSIIVTRKYINSNGENPQTGRREELPRHLKLLEQKLREEYNKLHGIDLGFDIVPGKTGENPQTGRREELPRHLKLLEQKLREEYNKLHGIDLGFDIVPEEDSVRLFDLIREVKEESVSSFGGNAEGESECIEGDLDLEPNNSNKFEDPIDETIAMVASTPHIVEPPLVAPVLPFNAHIPTPAAMSRCKKYFFSHAFAFSASLR